MDLICALPGGINCRWFFVVAGFIDLKSVAGVKVSKQKLVKGDAKPSMGMLPPVPTVYCCVYVTRGGSITICQSKKLVAVGF